MIQKTIPSATEFIRIASDTANHFGFRTLREVSKDKRCKNCTRIDRPKMAAIDRRLDSLHGILSGGIALYFENNLYSLEEPVLFHTIEQIPRSGDVALTLQIFGVEKSIAETLLIQTASCLMQDLGFPTSRVRINTLGDRESIARYTRELTNFMRKRIEELPSSARELMKEHVLVALMHLIERKHELSYRSPSPLEYLNETSRRHFRNIIEYLDMSDISYEIDTRLLGHHHCYSQTIFSIEVLSNESENESSNVILARGGRYDEFVRYITRRNVPAVGLVIALRERKAPLRMPRMKRRAIPSVFLVQLGPEPKMRSLLLLQELKRAKIPAYQALVSDSLSEQLRLAESRKVPYSIILGQKEFIDDTVIVRDMRNSSQESIPTTSLVSYLRRTIRK